MLLARAHARRSEMQHSEDPLRKGEIMGDPSADRRQQAAEPVAAPLAQNGSLAFNADLSRSFVLLPKDS